MALHGVLTVMGFIGPHYRLRCFLSMCGSILLKTSTDYQNITPTSLSTVSVDASLATLATLSLMADDGDILKEITLHPAKT